MMVSVFLPFWNILVYADLLLFLDGEVLASLGCSFRLLMESPVIMIAAI
jgi:hypothetical protein